MYLLFLFRGEGAGGGRVREGGEGGVRGDTEAGAAVGGGGQDVEG